MENQHDQTSHQIAFVRGYITRIIEDFALTYDIPRQLLASGLEGLFPAMGTQRNEVSMPLLQR